MISRFLLRRFVAALAVASLCACVADATVVDRHATPAQAAEKAIIIVSVSQDREFRGASARFIIDGGTPDAVKIQSAAQTHLEVPIRNHFRDKYGHVYVLELAPGHHRFTGWAAHWRNLHFTRGKGPGPVPLEFDAASGDVLYIGNLHANWVVGKALFGNRVPYESTVTVKDNSKGDIAIAEHETPAIAGKARLALLPLGPWAQAPADSMAADEGAAPSGTDKVPGN
jgi:hypothetical protein